VLEIYGGVGEELPRYQLPQKTHKYVQEHRTKKREVLLQPHHISRALPKKPAPHQNPNTRELARQHNPPKQAQLLHSAPPPKTNQKVTNATRQQKDTKTDQQDHHGRRDDNLLSLHKNRREPANKTNNNKQPIEQKTNKKPPLINLTKKT